MNIYSRPRNGVEFDPEGKTLRQATASMRAVSFSKQDAVEHCVGMMDDLDRATLFLKGSA